MGSLHKARLARRLAAMTEMARRKVARRAAARGHAEAVATIRVALAATTIDPASLDCLRVFGDAEAQLEALGDSPDVQAADAAFAAAEPTLFGRDETLSARAARLAPGFRGKPPPDRGASLRDWYAWSLAAHADSVIPGRGPTGPRSARPEDRLRPRTRKP
jgi:hypothetical protein